MMWNRPGIRWLPSETSQGAHNNTYRLSSTVYEGRIINVGSCYKVTHPSGHPCALEFIAPRRHRFSCETLEILIGRVLDFAIKCLDKKRASGHQRKRTARMSTATVNTPPVGSKRKRRRVSAA